MAGETLDWSNQTNIHPVGLLTLVALGVCVLTLSRPRAVACFLVMACLIPSGQRLVVGGLDFTLLRVLVLFGLARVAFGGESARYRFHPLDGALIAWGAVSIVAGTLLAGGGGMFITLLGNNFDALGGYFVFRMLIRTWRDIDQLVRSIAMLAIPVALFFVIEKATARNMFSVFGGVPAVTAIRQGSLRAQGAFSHPIMAGCFWATCVALLLGRRLAGRERQLMLIGSAAGVLIILACSSSTPVAGLLVVLIGTGLYRLREYTRQIRAAFVLLLVVLHFIREQPVWHLMARIDFVGGSTGWHRYHLVDQAIHRFPEWALIGTQSTAHWGLGLQDVTNQYVLEGVRGGALRLALFILIVTLAFRSVGRSLRRTRSMPREQALSWGIGVAMLGHSFMFLATSYFGQIVILWFLTLAMAASLSLLPGSCPPAARTRRSGDTRGEAGGVGPDRELQHSRPDDGVHPLGAGDDEGGTG